VYAQKGNHFNPCITQTDNVAFACPTSANHDSTYCHCPPLIVTASCDALPRLLQIGTLSYASVQRGMKAFLCIAEQP